LVADRVLEPVLFVVAVLELRGATELFVEDVEDDPVVLPEGTETPLGGPNDPGCPPPKPPAPFVPLAVGPAWRMAPVSVF
jgi:hypothetical protein